VGLDAAGGVAHPPNRDGYPSSERLAGDVDPSPESATNGPQGTLVTSTLRTGGYVS
jgi:hypothetical protein